MSGRRDRSRSRSPKPATGEVEKPLPWAGMAPLDEEDSPEVAQIRVAINALPRETGEKLKTMFTSNGLCLADLEVKAVMTLSQLNVALQQKVMQHLESERKFLENSRSKARFLISTCERAKTGALDVRGFGAIDPWKNHLNCISVQMPETHHFEDADEWLDKYEGEGDLVFDINIDGKIVRLTADLRETGVALKEQLQEHLPDVDMCKMQLRHDRIGYLRDSRSFAFYNLRKTSGIKLTYVAREKRGGFRHRRNWDEVGRQSNLREPYHVPTQAVVAAPQKPMPMMNMAYMQAALFPSRMKMMQQKGDGKM